MQDCKQCGGTGYLILDKSWIRDDGWRRETCGICGGSGKSDYRPHPEFSAQQANRRRTIGRPEIQT